MADRSSNDKQNPADAKSTLDPFEVWRDWITQSEQQWNRLLNEAMATDQFGRSSSRLMELFLTFQRGMNEATQRYFTILNLPTRTDVLTLGERLTAIEEQLVGIESALQALEVPGHSAGSARQVSDVGAEPAAPKKASKKKVAARPRRTKKPPSRGTP